MGEAVFGVKVWLQLLQLQNWEKPVPRMPGMRPAHDLSTT